MPSISRNKIVQWAKRPSRYIQHTIINSRWAQRQVGSYYRRQEQGLLVLMASKTAEPIDYLLKASKHHSKPQATSAAPIPIKIFTIDTWRASHGQIRTILKQVSTPMALSTYTPSIKQVTHKNWINNHIQTKTKWDTATQQTLITISICVASSTTSKLIQTRYRKQS